MSSLLDDCRRSISPEVRLIGVLGTLCRQGAPGEEIFQEFLELGSWQSTLSLYHRELLVDGFTTTSWPAEVKARLKAACLQAVQSGDFLEGELDREVALPVLLSVFPSDGEVGDFLAGLIRGGSPSSALAHLGGPYEPWEAIAKGFRDHPGLVEAIDKWIGEASNGPEVCWLAQVGRTAAVKARLLELLGKEFRFWTAQALIDGWGCEDEDVRSSLQKLALGDIGDASEIAVQLPIILGERGATRQRLLELLQSKECRRPDFVVKALCELQEGQLLNELVPLVLGLLKTRTDAEARAAVEYLLEANSEQADLVRWAFQEFEAKRIPGETIARLYGNRLEVRNRFRRPLLTLPVRLRGVLVTGLSRVARSVPVAREVLAKYIDEHDEAVRTLASIGYHRALAPDSDERREAVVRLQSDLRRRAHVLMPTRAAAFAGLVAVGRLDVLRETEVKGRLQVSVTSFQGLNLPLIRFVLERWGELQQGISPNFIRALSPGGVGIASALEALCAQAGNFPEAAEELLRVIEKQEQPSYGPESLRLLARRRPKSLLLADRALEAIARRSPASDGTEYSAAVILGEQFGGDADIAKRLLAARQPGPVDPVVTLALCVGWPKHGELERIRTWLSQNEANLPLVMAAYLTARTGSPSDVVRFLQDELNAPLATIPHRLRIIMGPILWRLARDEQVFEDFLVEAIEHADISVQTLFARSLFLARQLPARLREWCVRQLDWESRPGSIPTFTHDPAARELHAVRHILLEILTGTTGEVSERLLP
jgi:hypothetical protein